MRRLLAVGSLLMIPLAPSVLGAQTCTTQAVMPAATRDGIAQSGLTFVRQAQALDFAKIRANTIPAYGGDSFSSLQGPLAEASANIKSATVAVSSVWLLDASGLKPNADGSAADGQFSCQLKDSVSEVNFFISGLPTGRYALTLVDAASDKPFQLAVLMQEVAGGWRLAGFNSHATTVGGRNGLWYWQAARDYNLKKQPWNAWLYYQQAAVLVRPVSYMSTSHLDKLLDEQSKAAPPALSAGISADKPLALKASDGSDLLITALAPDNSLGSAQPDLGIHVRFNPPATGKSLDPAQSRARNKDVAVAMVKAYPELRTAFHGIWIIADTQGEPAFATQEPMSALR